MGVRMWWQIQGFFLDGLHACKVCEAEALGNFSAVLLVAWCIWSLSGTTFYPTENADSSLACKLKD